MIHTLNLALVQQSASEDRTDNIDRAVLASRQAAAAGAQIITFAELAFDPFYPQEPATKNAKDSAEPIPGPTTEIFSELARELEVVFVLNLYERDGEKAYDTSPVIDADGTLLGKTRMIHITDFECFHERGYYDPGDTGAPIYTTRHGKLGVAICYDRHYPEYMRALGLAGADLVVVPQAGADGEWAPGVFEAELQVAALQNGYFAALCNRVGDEKTVSFAGQSFVCDPTGRILAQAPGLGQEGCLNHTLHCQLDLSSLEQCPARQLFLGDRRPELYGEWLINSPADQK